MLSIPLYMLSMPLTCQYSIHRVFTIHGSADEIIPVEDAPKFAEIIPNHKLHIMEGANHAYTSHQAELALVVMNSIKETLQQDKGTRF